MTKVFISSLLLITLNVSAQIDKNKISTTQKFDEVITYISKKYVDSVDTDKLTDAAIVALLEELDPHSTYIPKEEVEAANRQINGRFVGLEYDFKSLEIHLW